MQDQPHDRPDEFSAAGYPSRAPVPDQHPEATARVVWVMIFLLGMLMVRYAVPFMVEEITRAMVRGRQRAEYEVATQYVNQVSFDSVSKAYQMVSQRVAPSVVHINVIRGQQNPARDERAFMFGGRSRTQDQGSGVIMDAAGHILTNRHVVLDGHEIQVTLSDGRRVLAELAGTDALTDLAVIRIQADKLIPAEWGDSDSLEVGALVWAAGSPFGLQSTVTAGILSAKNRAGFAGTPHQDFLQTDAAVNPGNSGGPLVDASGRVVGINTAIIGESYQGISFAVPSSVARAVYDRLRIDGHMDRGYLGVEMADLDDELIKQRYVINAKEGALVTSVMPNSPASAAGIRELDVIVNWNGVTVDSPTAVSRAVARTPIHSSASVTVIRDGNPLVLRAVIGRRRER
ncbi:MAG: trypsin-like peptidase domain-containing protein [Planctomycetales bacterium]|nr:trypsin-like peptidase domain-containing protein [Planctomycetales bacterium]